MRENVVVYWWIEKALHRCIGAPQMTTKKMAKMLDFHEGHHVEIVIHKDGDYQLECQDCCQYLLGFKSDGTPVDRVMVSIPDCE